MQFVNTQVEWPVEKAPALVLFESEEPHFYKGEYLYNSDYQGSVP